MGICSPDLKVQVVKYLRSKVSTEIADKVEEFLESNGSIALDGRARLTPGGEREATLHHRLNRANKTIADGQAFDSRFPEAGRLTKGAA